MREIKFRGKRVDNGEWVYGCYTFYEYESQGGDFVKTEIGHFILPILSVEEDFPYQVIPETVGQYTGFKDKNGKEIYEGDRILFHEEEECDIYWCETGCCFYFSSMSYDKNSFVSKFNMSASKYSEVIGNIHDKE